MRIVNDDGIHIRNIYSTFNNIGTNEYIIFFIDEIHDALLQIMSFHLTMCIPDTEVGAKCLDNSCHFCKPLYPVMNEKNLASPFRFEINGFANKIFVIKLYFGLYGLAVWRRRIDDAKISRPHQAEL